MLKKIFSIKSIIISIIIFIMMILFVAQKNDKQSVESTQNLSVAEKITKEKFFRSLEAGKDWTSTGFLSFSSWTASSTDNTHLIACVTLPNQTSYFVSTKEFVISDNLGVQKKYKNPKSFCPFKWVDNIVYGVGNSYEEASDVFKMEMLKGNVPGKVTPLGFQTNGRLDPSKRYLSFTNSLSTDAPYLGVLFCTTGDIYPSWLRSDQLGFIDLQTGKITILLSNQEKVYGIIGWSRNFPKILYREYEAPKLGFGETDTFFCPSPSEGKLLSIDVLTREIKDESELLDAHIN